MGNTQSAKEIAEIYRKEMGPDLGPIFYEIRNQTISLHWNWAEYLELFGTSSDRVALLNKAAGTCFLVIHNALWNDALLHICRLTDPSESGNKPNLTIRRLLAVVDREITPRIEELVDKVVDLAEFARDWRNRWLSHLDLRLALGNVTKPLAPASRGSVKKVLSALVELLNYIELQYYGATTIYDLPDGKGNANSLLYLLREGIDEEEKRRERLLRQTT